MNRPDPRTWGLLALLALSVTGAVLDRRSPDWMREDPLARPFGAEAARDSHAVEVEEPAERPAPRRVHIDRATRDDLVALPGVGPVTADRILALRDSLGPLDRAEQLLAVKGIGPRKLSALRPWLDFGALPESSATTSP